MRMPEKITFYLSHSVASRRVAENPEYATTLEIKTKDGVLSPALPLRRRRHTVR